MNVPPGLRGAGRLQQGVCFFDTNKLLALRRADPTNFEALTRIVDQLGAGSMKAQGLGAQLTSIEKILANDQRLYVHVSESPAGSSPQRGRGNVGSSPQSSGLVADGILKVGPKTLFVAFRGQTNREIRPLCVLDIYIHESVQRGGLGIELFNFMLRQEDVIPEALAYDRPSPKLYPFLAKHFGLRSFEKQLNNFVVFDQYFTGERAKRPAVAGGGAGGDSGSGRGSGGTSQPETPSPGSRSRAAVMARDSRARVTRRPGGSSPESDGASPKRGASRLTGRSPEEPAKRGNGHLPHIPGASPVGARKDERQPVPKLPGNSGSTSMPNGLAPGRNSGHRAESARGTQSSAGTLSIPESHILPGQQFLPRQLQPKVPKKEEVDRQELAALRRENYRLRQQAKEEEERKFQEQVQNSNLSHAGGYTRTTHGQMRPRSSLGRNMFGQSPGGQDPGRRRLPGGGTSTYPNAGRGQSRLW